MEVLAEAIPDHALIELAMYSIQTAGETTNGNWRFSFELLTVLMQLNFWKSL